MAKTAFIGLGVMGFPMAGHLAAAGHTVSVYNRTRTKAEAWVDQHAGTSGATPAAAAEGAEFVFVCVGNDDDLRAVTTGAGGVLETMSAGSVLVDHTTASASVARELAEACAAKGIGFVDAPVSGGQAGAENGVLTVMCGGEEADFDRAAPVIDAYAQAVRLLGPAGSGQLAKMVNQICIAGLVQGLSEGISFAKHAGLDVKAVLDTIDKGAAGSWQMSNRGHTMADDAYDFGFAVDWMIKDLGICVAEADGNGAKLEIARQVLGFYEEVSAMGGGRWDTSSLLRRLDQS